MLVIVYPIFVPFEIPVVSNVNVAVCPSYICVRFTDRSYVGTDVSLIVTLSDDPGALFNVRVAVSVPSNVRSFARVIDIVCVLVSPTGAATVKFPVRDPLVISLLSIPVIVYGNDVPAVTPCVCNVQVID